MRELTAERRENEKVEYKEKREIGLDALRKDRGG